MTFLSQAKRYVTGEQIDNPHPAITTFGMCSAMEWSHLPVAGGIYDQDPELLEKFRILWHEKAQHDKREEAKRKNSNKPGSRGLRRR